jgi:hypothetical protein
MDTIPRFLVPKQRNRSVCFGFCVCAKSSCIVIVLGHLIAWRPCLVSSFIPFLLLSAAMPHCPHPPSLHQSLICILFLHHCRLPSRPSCIDQERIRNVRIRLPTEISHRKNYKTRSLLPNCLIAKRLWQDMKGWKKENSTRVAPKTACLAFLQTHYSNLVCILQSYRKKNDGERL